VLPLWLSGFTATLTDAASDSLKLTRLRLPLALSDEIAGAVTSGPPGPLTTTFPVMNECTLQWNEKAPAWVNLC
jgi:hypothetical protein